MHHLSVYNWVVDIVGDSAGPALFCNTFGTLGRRQAMNFITFSHAISDNTIGSLSDSTLCLRTCTSIIGW